MWCFTSDNQVDPGEIVRSMSASMKGSVFIFNLQSSVLEKGQEFSGFVRCFKRSRTRHNDVPLKRNPPHDNPRLRRRQRWGAYYL
jgi:hypothetical protein